jgi:site-specific recombinase XerD
MTKPIEKGGGEPVSVKAPAGRVIAVDALPLSYEELKPYLAEGCTLHVEAGPSGYRLRKPTLIPIKPGISLRDFDIVNYVVTSLSGHASAAIPWILGSPALMRLATYLRRSRTSSPGTLCQYILQIKRLCEWAGTTPDGLVATALSGDGTPDPKGVRELRHLIEEYAGELQARDLAPNTVKGALKAVRALLKVSGVEPPGVLLPQAMVLCEDRAPKPEELARMMEVADLRGRVIVSMLALGGFRIGTLVRLRYRHVKEDLEAGRTPVHIHVEADITKGKYGSYDTFLAAEAVDCLKLYLKQRRQGSPCSKIPPETITDESPLLRKDRVSQVKPLSWRRLHDAVRVIFTKAGLTDAPRRRRHGLRPHSIRKYFRTQLAALGVPRDYIDYMMGHKISTYHDIQMKGVDFLRNVYAASGLGIKPKTQVSRLDTLKEIIRAWGLDPERILVKGALSEPHRVIVAPASRDDEQVKTLADSLKEMLRKELLEGDKHGA